MEIYIISIMASLITYLIINQLIPIPEKEVLRLRIKKYFFINSFEDARSYSKDKKDAGSFKNRLEVERFLSKDFSDYIASSCVKITSSEFLIIWVCSAIVPGGLFAIIGANILTVFAFIVLGLTIPPFMISRARKKSQELFTAQLGEALIVMGNAIRSGFSFTQAMETVAEEMKPPISDEFSRCIREMKYGRSQEESLKKMADRIKNEDLYLLVSAVLTSSEVGGNLSDILDSISSTIKDRIRIKQEVKVLTSTGRMSALIIGLLPIFIVLILMILNPTYFNRFIDTSIGKAMIMGAVVLEIVGFTFIRKISDIRY